MVNLTASEVLTSQKTLFFGLQARNKVSKVQMLPKMIAGSGKNA
jgi:hypothetical protein